MKKFLAAILVLTLLMSTAALAANVYFKGTATLYEKSYARDKSSIVIKKGSVAELVEYTSDKAWAKVRIDKYNLWVRAKYVTETSKPVKLIYAAGGTNRSTVGSETTLTGYSKVKATGNCNIRATACLQGKSLGTFEKGKWMTFTGKVSTDSRGVDWYSIVTSKGTKGWVSSVYTELVK